ncbi:MAG TPA: hypothetical protein VK619_15355 [Pyrinomonadaceae bacterium]|nr:hypothetical protein [Pyrinomonadaceae bacterium]
MNFYQKLFAASITLLVIILFCVAPARSFQPGRDHLTDQEADLVRDAQALDMRMDIFIKAADRRVLQITNPNSLTPKQQQQETERFGELTGTRLDLLSDLAGILDEAITNIDDAASHTANANRAKLLPKALHKLAEASKRFITELQPLREQVQGQEREALEQALENAESIVQAESRLPSSTQSTH